MAKRARKLTPIVDDVRKRNRAFHDRAETVMRKSDELAVLCEGTKVWVVIEKDEQLYVYRSVESNVPALSAHDKIIFTGPGDYRTHNEGIATGLASNIQRNFPPPSADNATPPPPAYVQAVSPPPHSLAQAATPPPPSFTQAASPSPPSRAHAGFLTSAPARHSPTPPPFANRRAMTPSLAFANGPRPGLGRVRSFNEPVDLTHGGADEDKTGERASKLPKFTHDVSCRIGSSSKPEPRVKPEPAHRSLLRSVPQWTPAQRSSSGPRPYMQLA